MNQKTSKVEKEFYLRCSYLTLSVLFDKEPKNLVITSFGTYICPSILIFDEQPLNNVANQPSLPTQHLNR